MSQPISEYLRRNVLGLVAIFIALGGVSWAAQNVRPNSVGSAAIKNGQVKGPDIAANAVTGPKVATDSLTGADINEGSLTLGANSVGSAQVIDDGLTGADVNEASLALPPVSPTGAAGGDLTGNYPNPTLAGNSVSGAEVSDASLTGADILDSSLDFTVVQQRVTGTCGAGTAMASIAQSGAVGCNNFPTSLPPSGSAGGDLTGTYPNPSIGSEVVEGAAHIVDLIRSVNLPLGAFVNCDATNFGPIDFNSGADTAPDFEALGDGRLTLNWDVSGSPNNDTDPVCISVVAPSEKTSTQPSVRLLAVAGLNGNNDWQLRFLQERVGNAEATAPTASISGTNCDAATTSGNIYACVLSTTTGSPFNGDSAVTIAINRSGGSDPMRLYGVEVRYQANQ